MATKLLDLLDIVDAVCEELKIQSTDTVTRSRIKRMINETYIQEVVPYARWKWLEKTYQVRFGEAYYGGTSSVTPDSATVTLSTAPNVSLGSFAGKLFATDSFSEVYVISAHTAGSTTVTLSSAYLGVLNATATFKIWTDKIALPTDCRETVTVWHNMHSRPMEGLGMQKFRETSLSNQKAEGYPRYYHTGTFKDPTSGTDETEADRYRELRIWPAVNTSAVTMFIDYIKEVDDLVDDGDEPVMPVEDRIILKYGALKTAWRTIARNTQEAEISKAEFYDRLQRMAGKLEDSTDKPTIQPDSLYVRRRRASRYAVGRYGLDTGGNSGGGNTRVTYLEDVTINGGTITNNITVASGKTIDGVDISALSTSLSDHIADTTDAHDASAISFSDSVSLGATDVQAALVALYGLLGAVTTVTLADNTASAAVAVSSTATNTSIKLDYSISRGAANIESGVIYIVNDGTNASIAQSAASIGTLGVVFTVDISGGNVRLLYTTTSTGTAASLKYTITARAA